MPDPDQTRLDDESLETLAYAMAHHLRAPARHVEAFAALLEGAAAALPAREREWLAFIRRAAALQSALMEDILAYLHLGSARLVRQRLDMAQEAGELVAELRLQPAGARVAWSLGVLPAAFGDRTLARAILRNLLGNAVKFSSRAPSPAIQIGACGDGAAGVFFVRDNGVGFDPRRAPMMFKPFERCHDDPDLAGHGMGLAIVKRLVTRHGGRVWADSAPGDGATFHFTLQASA